MEMSTTEELEEGVSQKYWKAFAEVWAYPFKADGELAKFTRNPAVTGAFAEAWISGLARQMMPAFKVSTGSIIKQSDGHFDLRKVPQCDIIIWDPGELPAIFEQGNFALVPHFSVRAIIEVKRSTASVPELNEQLKKLSKCLPHTHQHNILGVVVSHEKKLFQLAIEPDWIKRSGKTAQVTRILNSRTRQIDADGVFALIYFLAQVAGHNRLMDIKID